MKVNKIMYDKINAHHGGGKLVLCVDRLPYELEELTYTRSVVDPRIVYAENNGLVNFYLEDQENPGFGGAVFNIIVDGEPYDMRGWSSNASHINANTEFGPCTAVLLQIGSSTRFCYITGELFTQMAYIGGIAYEWEVNNRTCDYNIYLQDVPPELDFRANLKAFHKKEY